jgi:putative endonuclease
MTTPRCGWVYIVASDPGTLHTGVTSDIKWRIHQHKHHLIPGFTSQHNCHRLVFYERLEFIAAAIEREKQIKGWRRVRKEALIRNMNPLWKDLSEGWYWTEGQARGPSASRPQDDEG